MRTVPTVSLYFSIVSSFSLSGKRFGKEWFRSQFGILAESLQQALSITVMLKKFLMACIFGVKMISSFLKHHWKFTVSWENAKGQCAVLLLYTVNFQWRFRNGRIIFDPKHTCCMTFFEHHSSWNACCDDAGMQCTSLQFSILR